MTEYVPAVAVLMAIVTGQAGVPVPPGLQVSTPPTKVGAVKLEGVVTAVKVILSVLKPAQPFSGVAVMLTLRPEAAPWITFTCVALEPTATHGILQVVAQALLLNTVPV